jgi:hypothetical protein
MSILLFAAVPTDPGRKVSDTNLVRSGSGGFVSRTAEDASNGAKHPDTVNHEMLKDCLGTTDQCAAQNEVRLSDTRAEADSGPSERCTLPPQPAKTWPWAITRDP